MLSNNSIFFSILYKNYVNYVLEQDAKYYNTREFLCDIENSDRETILFNKSFGN